MQPGGGERDSRAVNDRDRSRNPGFERLKVDAVTKPDGRYLLYYSWPDDPTAEADEGGPLAQTPGSRQQPWTPEGGPADDDAPQSADDDRV